MSAINSVHFTGNLTTDPEFRFLESGIGRAVFGLAVNKRVRNEQTGQWEDGAAMFIRVTAFRELAENIAESLKKGTYVSVDGELRQNNYTTDNGEKRTTYEVVADNVSANLKFATAKVTKTQKGTRRPSGAPDQNNAWATSTPAAPVGAAWPA
jgi:single-strand DNA-binding protein